MIARAFTNYFSKPRGKAACLAGAILITPIVYIIRARIKRAERKLQNNTLLLGRLELCAVMIRRWWKV